jgi:cytochrome c oxidase subunit 3
MSISHNSWTSVFFLTTGFHGLHVTGGLIAFLLVLARTYSAKRFTHDQQISAIVVSYYWHFVDVVWVGLFTVIYLVR